MTAMQMERRRLFEEGLPIKDIAAMHGVSYGAAWQSVHPETNRVYNRARYKRRLAGRVPRRYRCSWCDGFGHRRTACPEREAGMPCVAWRRR